MIIYACVCRSLDATILAESSNPQLGGNAAQVTLALMEALRDTRLLSEGERKTFSQQNENSQDFFADLISSCTGGLYVTMDGINEEHFFHVWHKSGVYYNCLSDDDDYREQQVNFAFLEKIEQEFVKEFRKGRIAGAKSLALNKKFLPTLRSTMHYYNLNHNKLSRDQKVQNMLDRVENLKNVLGHNIQLVLRNQQEELDQLMEQSEMMKQDAAVFKKTSHAMKQSVTRKKRKWGLIIAFSVVAIIYLILSLACGFTLTQCRIQSS